MNIYKEVKTFLIALGLISLTSCNVIENVAVENLTEQATVTTQDVTTLETETTTEVNKSTSKKTKTSSSKNDSSKNGSKGTVSDLETVTTTSAIDLERLNEITTPAYNDNYVTTTEGINYPIEESTYNTTLQDGSPSIDTSYLEKYCAFIGDSLTVGLSAYGFIPEEHTFAKEGLTLKGVNSLQLQTDNGYLNPAQAVASWKLKEVYIMLGINGVSWIDNDEAIAEYTTLIESIREYNPNIQINVISVLPVSYSMETIDTVANGRILNSEIDEFNCLLQSMSSQLDCHYIDANTSMKDEGGYLYDDITFDGLHLTISGYERLLNILVQDAQCRN